MSPSERPASGRIATIWWLMLAILVWGLLLALGTFCLAGISRCCGPALWRDARWRFWVFGSRRWRCGGADQRASHVTAHEVCLLLTAVELFVGDAEVFEDAAVNDRFFDDARHVGELDAAVPDGLRVNYDGRTELALVEAA